MSPKKKPAAAQLELPLPETPRERPEKWVRLGCLICFRDDFDGISETHLELIRPFWLEIDEVQSWEDATTVWTEEQCREHFRSNLDWWTHLGTCPDCLNEA